MIPALFSVVVPTYNRPEILSKTLDCLETQNASFEYEVIVVDDGSTMPVPELGFGKGKRTNWKLLRNERNMGRAATRNRGIRESKGEYILMLDDDIWATPSLLQAHYDAQQRISGGVVVGVVPPAQEVNDTIWHRYIKRRFERIHKRLQTTQLDYGLFLTGNVSVPAKLLKDLGGFNETFKDYSFEDTEMGYRMYKKGVRFYHATNAIGYHFFNENLNSLCRKAYQMGRSAHTFVELHPDELRAVQYHSITLGAWRGKEAVKNLIKMMFFNKTSHFILKTITLLAETLKLEGLVFVALPWVEMQSMAKGVKDAVRADRH